MATFAAAVALLAFTVVGTETVGLDGGTARNVLNIKPRWSVDVAFESRFQDYDVKVQSLKRKVETLLNNGLYRNGLSVSLYTVLATNLYWSGGNIEPSPTNYNTLVALLKKALVGDGREDWSKFGAYIFLSGEDRGSAFQNWADEEFDPNGSWLSYVKKGTVCSANRHERVIMVRYVKNDDETAKAIATAIAYFLGIGFDFVPSSSNPRQDTAGKSCQGGFMDKLDLSKKAVEWSQCSKEDFIQLYTNKKLSCVEGP